jgi:hypothetical protein
MCEIWERDGIRIAEETNMNPYCHYLLLNQLRFMPEGL